MDETFKNRNEKLIRAVLPREIFWHEDGTLSSAAFKDKKGLSVDRDGGRPIDEAVRYAESHLQGSMVYVTVGQCVAVQALVRYLPLSDNQFHSEIHQSEEKIVLSNSQARKLSLCARVVKK